jgi:hypothetical protein
MRTCAYKECGKVFEPSTHNQRYHTSECCRLATNARIMENYYEKKSRRQGRVRVCSASDCHTLLSRYNEDSVCSKCASANLSAERENLKKLFQWA